MIILFSVKFTELSGDDNHFLSDVGLYVPLLHFFNAGFPSSLLQRHGAKTAFFGLRSVFTNVLICLNRFVL